MWVVLAALRRPYTFVVLALLVAIFGVLAALDTPTDIFPSINIPVVSVVWTHNGLEARTLLVELHADNPDGLLQPGAYAQVVFQLAKKSDPVLVIPTDALLFREQGLQVATLGPGYKIELKSVTVERNLGADVEVVSGLSAFDRVVDSPPNSLASGDLVHVASDQTPASEAEATAPG